MANIGLDGFLGEKEKRLVDLDWLNVNQEDYENLPFNAVPSYIAVPKLVEQWSHTEDSKNTHLVPNSEFNFNYNLPTRMSSDIEKDVKELVKLTAKEMMSGKTGNELVKVIKEKSTPQVIKAAQESLATLAKEQGLLGGVYIDPTVFSSCVEGSSFVAKKAKTAKYVKAMSTCASCVHNDASRCAVYKKRISTEITYDQELFSFYSRHIGSILGKTIEIQSKNDLQKAFSARKEDAPRVAEYKPKISKSKEEKEVDTLEKKTEEFKNQIESLKTELSNVFGSKIARDVSSLMSQEYSAKVIKEHIARKYSADDLKENKDILNYVLSKQGSLGKVYVEADMFPQDIPLANNLDNIPNVKFIIIRPDSQVLQNPGLGTFKNRCRGLNKTIVDSVQDIPKETFLAEFQKYPEQVTAKLASIFEKNPIQGLRLAFLQKDLVKKTAKVITENFDLQAKLDPTRYEPTESKEVILTPKKIASALDKGFPISSIIKTGRKLGVTDETIKANLKIAFESVQSIHKRQIDIPVVLPESVKVKVSQKDLSFELDKKFNEHSAHSISFGSSEAPVDTLVKDLELKGSDLDLKGIDKKSSDIEISGMDEFTID